MSNGCAYFPPIMISDKLKKFLIVFLIQKRLEIITRSRLRDLLRIFDNSLDGDIGI